MRPRCPCSRAPPDIFSERLHARLRTRQRLRRARFARARSARACDGAASDRHAVRRAQWLDRVSPTWRARVRLVRYSTQTVAPGPAVIPPLAARARFARDHGHRQRARRASGTQVAVPGYPPLRPSVAAHRRSAPTRRHPPSALARCLGQRTHRERPAERSRRRCLVLQVAAGTSEAALLATRRRRASAAVAANAAAVLARSEFQHAGKSRPPSGSGGARIRSSRRSLIRDLERCARRTVMALAGIVWATTAHATFVTRGAPIEPDRRALRTLHCGRRDGTETYIDILSARRFTTTADRRSKGVSLSRDARGTAQRFPLDGGVESGRCACSATRSGVLSDVDGDGYDDHRAAAPTLRQRETDEGVVFATRADSGSSASRHQYLKRSNSAGALFGAAIAAPRRERRQQLRAARRTPQFTNGQLREGRAYVYLGGDGVLERILRERRRQRRGAQFGRASISAASTRLRLRRRDRSPYYSGTWSEEGRVAVYSGKASGVENNPGFVATGGSAGAIGSSVGTRGRKQHGYGDLDRRAVGASASFRGCGVHPRR